MILMCVVYIKIKSYKCNIDSENTASPEVRKYKCFTFTVSQKKWGRGEYKSSQVVASKKLV